MSAAEQLKDLLKMDGDSAVVIHDPSNLFYLTGGYTGEGVLYISRKRDVIITDFRYIEQAERQAPAFQRIMVESPREHRQYIADLAAEDMITELRFESNYLSVEAYQELRSAVGEEVSYVPLGKAPQILRQIKTETEIAAMRKAADITTEAFASIIPVIREGMTERELQIELDYTMLRLGAQGNAFSTIIASGENGSLPHAVPGERRLRNGDMITMDFGARAAGYCSDMTRTVALGMPPDEMIRVYDTVLEAQTMCEEALAAGKNCFDIDQMAREHIDAAGYAGRFGHGLGHSVGIDIHEEPRLSQRCHDILRQGMVITVEPGIYIPGLGGVRIEDTCLVKENGCEPLTRAEKKLIIL